MEERPARYVIVGNGVAGTTAAEQLRKGDPYAEIVLIGAEPYPLYNRVALPPLLKGKVREEKVLMRTVADHEKLGIDLRLRTRVKEVIAAQRLVITEDGDELPYDKLLIATGGRPKPLPAPGAHKTRYIFNFQTLDDTKEIIARIAASKSACVVGGSYIAYELAEGFRARGLETTWVIRGPRFLHRILDEEGGELVDRIARAHGVQILYNSEVAQVHSRGEAVSGITTTRGVYVPADIVGVGVGLTLNTELLAGSGVEIGCGVRTDEYLRTSDPHIYAAGDVAEFYDTTVQSYHTMGTWNNSVSHGKVAAENMLGARIPYVNVPTYTSGLFDSKLAVMGATPDLVAGLDSVAACNLEEKWYRRLFFLEGRLVGAVLIGDMSARRRILHFIRSREPVRNAHALLTT